MHCFWCELQIWHNLEDLPIIAAFLTPINEELPYKDYGDAREAL